MDKRRRRTQPRSRPARPTSAGTAHAGRYGGVKRRDGHPHSGAREGVRASRAGQDVQETSAETTLGLRAQGKYRLGRKIGSGSFGDIYIGASPRARPVHAPAWRGHRFGPADDARPSPPRRYAPPDRRGGRHQAGARAAGNRAAGGGHSRQQQQQLAAQLECPALTRPPLAALPVGDGQDQAPTAAV